jgi:hypothetical protein
MLNERRKHLLHLRSSWITPFASAIRYDSHISVADNIVASLINGSVTSPANSLVWRPPKSNFNICTSVLLEEDSQEQLGSWNDVSSKITDREEAIVRENSREVDVIMPEITSISSPPVSSVVIYSL